MIKKSTEFDLFPAYVQSILYYDLAKKKNKLNQEGVLFFLKIRKVINLC